MTSDLKKARQILIDKMSEVPRTIVYIDTDNDALSTFREFFSLHQYNIKTFNDPIEAFYWIKNNTVDLIVSEISLPMLSGVSLLRKIRLHDKLSGIPFILVTDNMVKFIPDAKKVKANDLYPKPLDLEKLLTRIKYLSKITLDQDTDFYILQKTWSRKIYPGHFKRFTSFVLSIFLLTLTLPLMFLIFIILKFQKVKPLTFENKIGAGYDLVTLYNFNTQSKFGIFLKKYNIQRWPEIFNVILGDLSIVGNKALSLEEAKMYTSDKQSLRFLSPTGLTGSRHIYDTQDRKSIEDATTLENEYAMNRGFYKDVLIFLKSLKYLFANSNHSYYDL